MNHRILVTGSSGLVGAALTSAMLAEGAQVARLDLRAHGVARGDVRDLPSVREAIARVDGVVHLAAVSRVVDGERDPDLCRATNVDGLRNVLMAAAESPRAPWVIFASSREVYGHLDALPATEDAPLRPVNHYGRSKLAGERLASEAQRAGVRAWSVRLSNVYGSTADHADRVVPAFARAAAVGAELRADGLDHTFDFTHVDDVVRGVLAMTTVLAEGGATPPPIHLVSGRPTTLGELASLAVQLGQSGATIRRAPPRDFDVARFVGDPSRAEALLGWRARVALESGVAELIHAFRRERVSADALEVAR